MPVLPPGDTFTYRFKVEQSGTYWYHSHSGMQEQTGMYGAIVIEPRDGESIRADREHVVQLSDWTDEDPMRVLRQAQGAERLLQLQPAHRRRNSFATHPRMAWLPLWTAGACGTRCA